MTQSELKANLMRELEAEVDKLLESREGGKRLTLMEIEDAVLEMRQRLGQKIAESMIEAQEVACKTEAPISAATGKCLERKGKKHNNHNTPRVSALCARVLL